MNNIKLIVSDLDGTIIQKDNTITSITQDILLKLIAQGTMFLPCTGRSFHDTKSILPNELMQSAILLNGALFVNKKGKSLFSFPMRREDVCEIEKLFLSNGMPCLYFTKDSIYRSGNLIQLHTCMHHYYPNMTSEEYFTTPITPVGSHTEIFDDILKMESMHIIKDSCKNILAKAKCCENVQITSSLPYNVEVTARNVDKAEMLKKVIAFYGIQKEELLFFGDSSNDMAVFQQFPNCVAVENAIEDIKQRAIAICASCEQDGVASYLLEHIHVMFRK